MGFFDALRTSVSAAAPPKAPPEVAQAPAPPASSPSADAVMTAAIVHDVRGSSASARVLVSLPASYAAPEKGRVIERYPVLYVLDLDPATVIFPVVAAAARAGHAAAKSASRTWYPELIVVGVTPTVALAPSEVIGFVAARLLSFVDNQYATKPYKEKRALCGAGLGGGAVLHALCTSEDAARLIGHFLACGPATPAALTKPTLPRITANAYLFGREKDAAELAQLRSLHKALEGVASPGAAAQEVRVDPSTGEQRVVDSERRAVQTITLDVSDGTDTGAPDFLSRAVEWVSTWWELAQLDSLARQLPWSEFR